MAKYLKTYHNDIKIARVVDGCEECPLMKHNKTLMRCTCKIFNSCTNDNVVDDFVISYNINTQKVNDKIKIPVWCGLASSYDELSNTSDVYRCKKNLINITRNDKSRNLPIILSKDIIKQEVDIINKNYLFSNSDKDGILLDDNSNIDLDEFDDFFSWKHVDKTPNKFVCSSCGEECDSVLRNNNNGICDNCKIVVNKDDYKIFINNFRLKRNISYSKELFKIT